MVSEVVLRPTGGMGGICVMNQVGGMQSVVPTSEVIEICSVIFGAFRIQANRFHLSAVNNQKHQQVDGAMTDVLELSLLDRAGNRASDRVALHYLEIRNFIYADDPLALCCQFPRIGVAPEDFFSPLLEFSVQAAGFPVTRSVRMKVDALQNPPNHAGTNGWQYPT